MQGTTRTSWESVHRGAGECGTFRRWEGEVLPDLWNRPPAPWDGSGRLGRRWETTAEAKVQKRGTDCCTPCPSVSAGNIASSDLLWLLTKVRRQDSHLARTNCSLRCIAQNGTSFTHKRVGAPFTFSAEKGNVKVRLASRVPKDAHWLTTHTNTTEHLRLQVLRPRQRPHHPRCPRCWRKGCRRHRA